MTTDAKMAEYEKGAPVLCLPALCYNLSPEELNEFSQEFPWLVRNVVIPYLLYPLYRFYYPFYYASNSHDQSMYEIKQ